MRLIVTGHREEKLSNYNSDWIASQINSWTYTLKVDFNVNLAYSGMASGVDIWFCEACVVHHIPFIACIPFEGQDEYMTEDTKRRRTNLLSFAKETKYVKNSWMVEHCDIALVVWSGIKGGTHNVVEQLIEKKKPFLWINPVSEVVWKCYQ